MQLELKQNALSVHYNLGGSTHGHLGLLMTDTQYALISNAAYVHPIHPGIIHIPNNDTCFATNVLKRDWLVPDHNLHLSYIRY